MVRYQYHTEVWSLYEFVEILSDYDEGIGTNVAYLTKVKGF